MCAVLEGVKRYGNNTATGELDVIGIAKSNLISIESQNMMYLQLQ